MLDAEAREQSPRGGGRGRVKRDLPGVGFQKKIVGFVATVTLHATHVSFWGQGKTPLVGYLKVWSYRE